MRTKPSNGSVSGKHIAQRTCVACRRISVKGDLVRLVRTAGGDIEVDLSGKKTGRGAYLCPSRECWETALQGNRLEHALRGSLNRDNREQLVENIGDLIKGVNKY